MRNVTFMDFFYHQKETGLKLEAYEKVLLDCMLGDHMLFWRQDAVEQSVFSDPHPGRVRSCGDPRQTLQTYPAGSWGPEATHEL